MKNIRYDRRRNARIPMEARMERLRQVIREELTELQRYTLCAYYFRQQTITQIAAERNVNKTTVYRTLRRAEEKLRRFLQY